MMPHGVCLLWNGHLLITTVLANALIFLSYMTISGVLFYTLKIIEIPLSRTIITMFGWFILACGLTHLVDILVIWWPIYWVQAIVGVMTAIPSVSTALYMLMMLRRHYLNQAHTKIVIQVTPVE